MFPSRTGITAHSHPIKKSTPLFRDNAVTVLSANLYAFAIIQLPTAPVIAQPTGPRIVESFAPITAVPYLTAALKVEIL